MERYRTLAEARPDAFLPDLAGSLNNFGGDLSALGRGARAYSNNRVEKYRSPRSPNTATTLPLSIRAATCWAAHRVAPELRPARMPSLAAISRVVR